MTTDERRVLWEQMGDAARALHYRAAGHHPPAWLSGAPCGFHSEEHHQAFTVLRARRRVPRRGERCFDLHLPRDYAWRDSLGWSRVCDLYRRWYWLDEADGLSSTELDDLDAFLSEELRPADVMSFAPFRADGSLIYDWPLRSGWATFSVRAPPAVLRSIMLRAGWPEGARPTVSRLVSHVLDRMEYRCAWHFAEGFGIAAEWMSGRVDGVSWLGDSRVYVHDGTRDGVGGVRVGGRVAEADDLDLDGDPTMDWISLHASVMDGVDVERALDA